MDSKQMLSIVENYCRKTDSGDRDIKVTRVADKKSMFVEQIGDDGRAVMLSEYTVDGVMYYAGYSSRSQTVYISMVA
ncbi:MAG: hypothetical protein IPP66_17460 [Anaerolineales bacterium]|nr:hypothetical protein [Anaerolineales bacterium]